MTTRPSVLAELGEELEQAARRALRPQRRRSPRPGLLFTAAGAALAVAIAVSALIALGHRRQPTATGAPPAAARQLVAELGVLRRAQTAEDRSLPAGIGPRHIVAGLTRLVATSDLGAQGVAHTYLVVAPPEPGCYTPAPESGDLAFLVTVFANHRFAYGLGFSAIDLRRFAVTPTPIVGLLTSVIPDDVGRVHWAVRGRQAGRFEAVSPAIDNNAAVMPYKGTLLPTSATWQLADGRVLTSAKEAASIPTCQPPLIVPGAQNPIAQWLGQDFSLFRTARLTHPYRISQLEFNESFVWRHSGLNFAQARFIVTGTGLLGAKPGVWVIPGTRAVCLIDAIGNGSCTPPTGDRFRGDAPPESGGFRISSATTGYSTNMYTGLVPDGNKTVTIILADGTGRTVAVVHNVYSVTVKGRARALIVKDSAGHTRRFTLYANNNQF